MTSKIQFKYDLCQTIEAADAPQETKDKMIKSIRIAKGFIRGEYTAWVKTEHGGNIPIKSEDYYDNYVNNHKDLAKKGISSTDSILAMLDLHIEEFDATLFAKYLHHNGIIICVASELMTAELKEDYPPFREGYLKWKTAFGL